MRNKNAILGGDGGSGRRRRGVDEDSVARRKSARSSASSGSGIEGSVFGGKIRGAMKKRIGIETRRRKEKMNGDEEYISRSRSRSKVGI